MALSTNAEVLMGPSFPNWTIRWTIEMKPRVPPNVVVNGLLNAHKNGQSARAHSQARI